MRCEKCGKEIISLKAGVFNRDGSDSDVEYGFDECEENAVVMDIDHNWTGAELSEDERTDTIHCPFCGEFPFKDKEIQVYVSLKVVMFKTTGGLNDESKRANRTTSRVITRGG